MINESSMNIFGDDKVYNEMQGLASIKDLSTLFTSDVVKFQSTLYPSNIEVWLTGVDIKMGASYDSANPPQVAVSLLGYAPWLKNATTATPAGSEGWVACGFATVLISELAENARANNKVAYSDSVTLPFRTLPGVTQYKVTLQVTDDSGAIESGYLYGNLQFDV